MRNIYLTTERLDHIERRLDDMAHVLRTVNDATKYF